MPPPPPSSTLFPYTTLFRSPAQWLLVRDEPGARLEGEGLLRGEHRGVLVVEVLPRHEDPARQVLLERVPGGELVLGGAVPVGVQGDRELGAGGVHVLTVRDHREGELVQDQHLLRQAVLRREVREPGGDLVDLRRGDGADRREMLLPRRQPPRSEEHTSELQSRRHRVCRRPLAKYIL